MEHLKTNIPETESSTKIPDLKNFIKTLPPEKFTTSKSETKKMMSIIENFKGKEIYLSYDCALVFLSLIALDKDRCNLSSLPNDDAEIIKSTVDEWYDKYYFFISLNKYKDFVLTFKHSTKSGTNKEFTFVNVIANPRQDAISPNMGVNIEVDEDNVNVGNIKLDKKIIKTNIDKANKTYSEPKKVSENTSIYKMFENDSNKKENESESTTIKTVNQSKNAYEIRADILSMTIDYMKWIYDIQHSTYCTPEQLELFSPDAILETTQKFYRFVEKK